MADAVGLSMDELAAAMQEFGTATIRRMPRRAGMLMIQLFHKDLGNGMMRETTYPGYSHIIVDMSNEMWSVTASEIGPPHSEVMVLNKKPIIFPQCLAGSLQYRISHFGITTMEGITVHLGELSGQLAVTAGVIPEFAPGDISIQEDGYSKWYDIL